jgi:hypothetical protein
MECLQLWPTCRGEKGKTLGKTYGIKVRCYWEHLWELIGNLKGIYWEQKKNENPEFGHRPGESFKKPAKKKRKVY